MEVDQDQAAQASGAKDGEDMFLFGPDEIEGAVGAEASAIEFGPDDNADVLHMDGDQNASKPLVDLFGDDLPLMSLTAKRSAKKDAMNAKSAPPAPAAPEQAHHPR